MVVSLVMVIALFLQPGIGNLFFAGRGLSGGSIGAWHLGGDTARQGHWSGASRSQRAEEWKKHMADFAQGFESAIIDAVRMTSASLRR